jgi:hypothetical protein
MDNRYFSCAQYHSFFFESEHSIITREQFIHMVSQECRKDSRENSPLDHEQAFNESKKVLRKRATC